MIGRVPILVMRDGDGTLGAFVNSCPHRGAQIAQRQCGNARLHVCAYHSWTFDSAGRNRASSGRRPAATRTPSTTRATISRACPRSGSIAASCSAA